MGFDERVMSRIDSCAGHAEKRQFDSVDSVGQTVEFLTNAVG